MTDGLTLGHPCCAHVPTKDEPTCTNPLPNNRHRFCEKHNHLHDQCAIVGCSNPNLTGSKACNLPEHQEMERQYKARGNASFTLPKRLRDHRARNQASAEDDKDDDDDDDDDERPDEMDGDVWFEKDGDTIRLVANHDIGTIGVLEPGEVRLEPLPCPANKSDKGNKRVRAQFSRKRVHNDQTLLFCCGVFYARASFYNAEAVSNVIVSITYTIPYLVLTLSYPAFHQASVFRAWRTIPQHDSL